MTPFDAIIGLARHAFRVPRSWMEGVGFSGAWLFVLLTSYAVVGLTLQFLGV